MFGGMKMKRNFLIIFTLILILAAVGCKSAIKENNSDEDIFNHDNKLNYLKGNDNQIDKDNNLIQIELPANYKSMEIKNYNVSDNLKRLDFSVLEGEGIPSIILKEPLEYKNKNPWFSNKDIKVLPVFMNNNYNLKYHEGPIEYLAKDESIEVSLLVAEKLGIDTTKYQCDNYGNSYIIYFPNKKESIVEIQPFIDEIRIFFDSFDSNKSISLPNINESNEENLHEKYIIYYYNLYESILRMEQPIFESTFERNIYGEKVYKYKIFNQEDTVEDTIVNYNTNYVRVYINTYDSEINNNGLTTIDLTYKQLMDSANSNEYENTILEKLAKRNELEVLGYYPLLSEEDVTQKVLSKEYISTIEYDRDIDLSDIMRIELIYYVVPINKTIQPVYKVYLDLKNTINYYDYYKDNDLNTYGIFYVPAIESKYLNLTEPNISTIEGTLITRMHYGPPGYGEDPDNDEQVYPFILQLDNPLEVIAKDNDFMNSNISDVSEIQLVLRGEPYVNMAKQYKNKHIKIQGTLFSAFSGHHYTDVLMIVDKILD